MRRISAAKSEATALHDAYSRSKGLCLDWSDLVWAELGRLKPEHWDIRDQERQTRPFHTGAVLCPEPASDDEEEGRVCTSGAGGCREPQPCLVFDPWQSGKAEVYEFSSWDRGSFSDRVPADFFLHELPEPRHVKKARR
jgi:hypothetical protein